MQEPFGSLDGHKTKAASLADAINRLLQNLVLKCAKSEGIRDYYHVGVIGYGGHGVKPAFTGHLAGKELVPVSEMALGSINPRSANASQAAKRSCASALPMSPLTCRANG